MPNKYGFKNRFSERTGKGIDYRLSGQTGVRQTGVRLMVKLMT